MGKVQAVLLEAARTNSALRSEDFTDGAWGSIGTVARTADDAVAPDGTTTADKIEDSQTGGNPGVFQTVTVADDSLDRAVSVFLKKQTGGPVALFWLRYDGGTALDFNLYVDPEDGSFSAERDLSGGTQGVDFDVEDYNSDWWRVWIVGANNGTGNTNLEWRLQPARRAAGDVNGSDDTSITGFQHYWGGHIEGVSGGAAFPSSYIATQGSAVSRAADDFPDTFPGSPQASTIYGKLNLDHIDTLGTIVHIGDETDGVRVKVDGGNNLVAELFNGASTASSSVALGHAYGDTVEFRAVYESDGPTTIHAALNGGSESSGATDSSQSLPGSFGSQDVQIGAEQDGSNPVNMALMSLLIVPGVRTMSEMRNLAGVS